MKKYKIFLLLFLVFSFGIKNVNASNNPFYNATEFYFDYSVVSSQVYSNFDYSTIDIDFIDKFYNKFVSDYPSYSSYYYFYNLNFYAGTPYISFKLFSDIPSQIVPRIQNFGTTSYSSIGFIYNNGGINNCSISYNLDLSVRSSLSCYTGSNTFPNTSFYVDNNYYWYDVSGFQTAVVKDDIIYPQTIYYFPLSTNINSNFSYGSSSYSFPITYDLNNVATTLYSYRDYLSANTISNPTITSKYLTTTGDDTGDKIGATTTVDFGVYDKTKYLYYLSFDNGDSWDNLTPRLTEQTYTFTKLSNFEVIAKIVDTTTGKEYYSTFLTDSIDSSYYSKWLRFEKDKDRYTEIDDVNYLYQTTVNLYQDYNQINGYPLQLYYSYDKSNWSKISNGIDYAIFDFQKNTTLYFIYRDQADQIVYRSTYTIDSFSEIESLGQKISFNEECDDDGCYVETVFVNYDTSNYMYFVKSGANSYSKIAPISGENFRGTYLFDKTNIIQTYCAKVTNNNNDTILEECHTVEGISNQQNMSSLTYNVKIFIDDQKNTLDKISDLIQKMYNNLPSIIQNFLVFSYFLTCMGAIVWNVRK